MWFILTRGLKNYVLEIITHQVNDTVDKEEEMEVWREKDATWLAVSSLTRRGLHSPKPFKTFQNVAGET